MRKKHTTSRYAQAVLIALSDTWEHDHEPPTLRDLAELAEVPSISLVHHALKVLERRGLAERTRRGRWKPVRSIHHAEPDKQNVR